MFDLAKNDQFVEITNDENPDLYSEILPAATSDSNQNKQQEGQADDCNQTNLSMYLYKLGEVVENEYEVYVLCSSSKKPCLLDMISSESNRADVNFQNYTKNIIGHLAKFSLLFSFGKPEKDEVIPLLYEIELCYCKNAFFLVISTMMFIFNKSSNLKIVSADNPEISDLIKKSDFLIYKKDISLLIFREYEFVIQVNQNLADLTFLYYEVNREIKKLKKKIDRFSEKIEFFLSTTQRMTHNLIFEFDKNSFLIEQSRDYFEILEKYFIQPFKIYNTTCYSNVSLYD